MDTPLIATTRRRVRRFRGQYRALAERAGLTYSWVSKFACGELGARPRYDLLERLLSTLDAMERERRLGGRSDHSTPRGNRDATQRAIHRSSSCIP